eukprot:COSAG01_NODE_34494_length_546_cov_5.326622_2_plen_48_part_01
MSPDLHTTHRRKNTAKVLVRLEDYYSAETAVWQPELPSRGPLLGRYAL